MAMLPRFLVALFCCVFCHGQAAARAPSIEAKGQNLVLAVPDGAQVQITRYDEGGDALGAPEDVLTSSEVQKMIRDGLDENKALFEAELVKAKVDMMANLKAEMRSAGTDAKVAALTQQVATLSDALAPLKKTLGETQKQVGDTSGATDDAVSCLAGILKAGAGGSWAGLEGCPKAETVMCGASADPAQGTVHGKGRHVGSVRVFDCDAATHLTGEPVSVCKEGGKWSHPAPTCTVTTTSTLTTTVTTTTNNPDIITCKCSGDDKVTSVVVDGTPIKLEHPDQNWGKQGTFQFKGNAKVVGVKSEDRDRTTNCQKNGFLMACISSRGSGPWHSLVTEAGIKSQLGFASIKMNAITGNAWATEKAVKANTPIELVSTTQVCRNGKWIAAPFKPFDAVEKGGIQDYARYQRYLATNKFCSQEFYAVRLDIVTNMLYCVKPNDPCTDKVDASGIQGLYRVPKTYTPCAGHSPGCTPSFNPSRLSNNDGTARTMEMNRNHKGFEGFKPTFVCGGGVGQYHWFVFTPP